jgi:hypothetical protein
MKTTKTGGPDMDALLKQALKDDLPPEVEARMGRHFFNLRRIIDRPEGITEADTRARQGEWHSRDRWHWMRWAFRKEILAFSSVVLMLLGSVMHLGGYQSALAHSISRLKVVVAISERLHRATSMDCAVLITGAGGETRHYRVRWGAPGVTRVDIAAAGRAEQTLWISNGAISIADYARGSLPPTMGATTFQDPILQPALAFLTPAILAQRMDESYGLKQAERQDGAGPNELLFVGRENQEIIEITVDERTFLPATLKRLLPDSGRTGEERVCLMEVRFVWNQPIPQELMVPGLPAGK